MHTELTKPTGQLQPVGGSLCSVIYLYGIGIFLISFWVSFIAILVRTLFSLSIRLWVYAVRIVLPIWMIPLSLCSHRWVMLAALIFTLGVIKGTIKLPFFGSPKRSALFAFRALMQSLRLSQAFAWPDQASYGGISLFFSLILLWGSVTKEEVSNRSGQLQTDVGFCVWYTHMSRWGPEYK